MSATEATVELQQQPPDQQQPDLAPQQEQQQPPACSLQPAEQQQETTSQDSEHHEQQCHICMNNMKEPTAVKGCGHQFCHSCIQLWVGMRQQPCCPVCRAEVKVLLLADGTEKVAEPPAAAPPAEAEPDLSCLDHSYFLAEVSRLQSRAQSVHNRVYREAYGCGRKGDAHSTGLMLDGVQDVMDTLAGYRSTLEGEVRFDPQMLLHELYRLDTQLTSLQSGNTGSSAAANPAGADAGSDLWQQHATDSLANLHLHDEYHHEHEPEGYHEHDYEYDSADDDDWHEGLSRTPGRRPTQRHVVKHGRSNSAGNGGGGGGQQQRQQQQGQQRAQLTPQQRGPIPRWRQGAGQGQVRQRAGGNGPTGL